MASIYQDKYKTIIAALVAARKTARITQQELATRLNKPQSFVSKYENGERRLDVAEFMEVVAILEIDYKKILDPLCGNDDG